jgi:hypothetical protein
VTRNPHLLDIQWGLDICMFLHIAFKGRNINCLTDWTCHGNINVGVGVAVGLDELLLRDLGLVSYPAQ